LHQSAAINDGHIFISTLSKLHPHREKQRSSGWHWAAELSHGLYGNTNIVSQKSKAPPIFQKIVLKIANEIFFS